MIDLGIDAEFHDYGSGRNIVGRLTAFGPKVGEASIVVGAHYDSVPQCPGANDNGTGVALVLAVAEHLAKYPCRERDFLFVLFDEEEDGLIGSARYAEKLKDDGENVHSVHTIDQMGWDSNADRLIELELPDDGLAALYKDAASGLGLSIPMKETSTSSTDHSSFRPSFSAIGLTEGYVSGDTTPHYHKSTDTYDTVNFEYLESTTMLTREVMGQLAYPHP